METHAVVREIAARRLTESDKERPVTVDVDPGAYENYLRGRFALERGELKKSIAYFEEAVSNNPNYAPAFAGLANAYISMGQPWYAEGDKRPSDVLPLAKAAATKAVKLDDGLAEGHLALARILQLYEWDFPEVEKEYRRTLELNRNDALAHGLFAEFLQEMGRTQEALDESRCAEALDPVNATTAANVGYMYYTGREYDSAMREFDRAMGLDSENVWVHVGRGWVFEQKKMYPQAIAELEEAVKLSKGHEVPLASLGEVLGEAGRRQEAVGIQRDLKERARERYVSPCLIAMVELGLGQRGDAIDSLEAAYADRNQWLLYMEVDPHLDALRSDPRFKNLLHRVGFQDVHP